VKNASAKRRGPGRKELSSSGFRVSVSDLHCKQSQEAWLVEKMGKHQMPLIVLHKYSRELHYEHLAATTHTQDSGND